MYLSLGQAWTKKETESHTERWRMMEFPFSFWHKHSGTFLSVTSAEAKEGLRTVHQAALSQGEAGGTPRPSAP